MQLVINNVVAMLPVEVSDDALGGLGVDWPDGQQQHSCPDSPDNLS